MCAEGGFFFSKAISVTSRLLERWEYSFFRMVKYITKSLSNIFHAYLFEEEIMKEIWLPWLLFKGRPRQGKHFVLDGLVWLSYLVGSSKSHVSTSCIFLQFPKHCVGNNFLWYSTILKKYSYCLKFYLT